MSWIRAGFVFFGVAIASVSGVSAQSSNLAYQVANMSEDVRLLSESISTLRLEMDEMRRENADLRALVKSYEGQSDSVLARSVSAAQLDRVVEELKSNDEATKQQVLAIVDKSMKDLTKKVGTIIGKMGSPANKSVQVPQWNTNFPESGTSYVVKSGDTLSSIAVAHKSKVEWIRHANKIVDVRILQLDQRLFIPIEQ